MDKIISTSEIESTETYKNLEKCFQNIATKLSSKKIITSGLLVYKNLGIIPSSVAGNNLKIIKELINKQK